jgi:hypothetical protein
MESGEVKCAACGNETFKVRTQVFSNGTKHVRCFCAVCEKFFQWLRQDDQPKGVLRITDIEQLGLLKEGVSISIGEDDKRERWLVSDSKYETLMIADDGGASNADECLTEEVLYAYEHSKTNMKKCECRKHEFELQEQEGGYSAILEQNRKTSEEDK